MRVGVVGVGAVGARTIRQLLALEGVDEVVAADIRPELLVTVTRTLGDRVASATHRLDVVGCDAVVVASPSTLDHVTLVRDLHRRDVPVVSVADGLEEVEALLGDPGPVDASASVVLGAGFAPGLSCLLARHAARSFDQVDEVHVAKLGTGGPACARQHHRALSATALDWRDGRWVRRRGGSGRELCWFPGPVDGHDCYRAALPDARLLASVFPTASRVTARVAATRRDRLTMHLPMLRPPHPEGRVGAVRVEVRGRRRGASDVVVLGAAERPAIAAAMVATTTVEWLVGGRIPDGVGGLGRIDAPEAFLSTLTERGLRIARFEGLPTVRP